jgi:hypothetical protein
MIVAKSKQVAESCKEGHCSKTSVLLAVVMVQMWYQHDGWTVLNAFFAYSVLNILCPGY